MHIHRHICVYARVHTCYTWELEKGGSQGGAPHPAFVPLPGLLAQTLRRGAGRRPASHLLKLQEK